MTEARALIPLTAYARTSTDDQQNPGESLRWQLSRANALIIGRAEIVAVVHDTDVSRSVPWSATPRGGSPHFPTRRPESRLDRHRRR